LSFGKNSESDICVMCRGHVFKNGRNVVDVTGLRHVFTSSSFESTASLADIVGQLTFHFRTRAIRTFSTNRSIDDVRSTRYIISDTRSINNFANVVRVRIIKFKINVEVERMSSLFPNLNDVISDSGVVRNSKVDNIRFVIDERNVTNRIRTRSIMMEDKVEKNVIDDHERIAGFKIEIPIFGKNRMLVLGIGSEVYTAKK